MMNISMTRLLSAILLIPALFVTACAPEPSDISAGTGDESAAAVDEMMTDAGAGMGHDMGARHQKMQAMMHDQMLSAGVEQGLITEEDALFFTETHPIIEEFHPEEAAEGSSMPSDAKKAMQRGIANMAVADGALSQEDADRFTEIHDILIEAGLMNE